MRRKGPVQEQWLLLAVVALSVSCTCAILVHLLRLSHKVGLDSTLGSHHKVRQHELELNQAPTESPTVKLETTQVPSFNATIWKVPPPIEDDFADASPDDSTLDYIDQPDVLEFLKSKDRLRKVRENHSWEVLRNIGRRSNKNRRRVICTLVLNMTHIIGEWLDFHLLVGFDKIVIYDHNSTDGLETYITSTYPSDVVYYKHIDFKVRKGGNQGMTRAQKAVFDHCLKTYWNISEVIATTDVDEYIYPAPQHWNEVDSLWSALDAMNVTHNSQATTFQFPCNHFGFGNYFDLPTDSMVASYAKRAPVMGLENATTKAGRSFQKFCERCDYQNLSECRPEASWTNPFCRMCRFCIHVDPFTKMMYFPGNTLQPRITPLVHWAVPRDKTVESVFANERELKRKKGIFCNHYRFRSFNDVYDKTMRNKASQTFIHIDRNHSYYALLNGFRDTAVADYLVQRRNQLDANGLTIF